MSIYTDAIGLVENKQAAGLSLQELAYPEEEVCSPSTAGLDEDSRAVEAA